MTEAELIVDEFEAELRRIDSMKPQPFTEKYVIPSMTAFTFISRLRAALRASSPSEPWRPISEAPKDGTVILVGGAGWCAVGHCGDEDGRWWTTHPCLIGVRPGLATNGAEDPTHWQPLPLPPRPAEGEEPTHGR